MSRPRIALVSPFPPVPTGIADYAVDLLKGLMEIAEVTCFTTAEADLPVPSFSLAEYEAKRWEFDATLYQMGNNPVHDEIYELAIAFPGYLFLHDYNLHDFIATRTADSFGEFTREMAFQNGADGIELAWKIASQLEGHPFENPLNARVVESSLGVIVHSQFVADLLTARHPDISTLVIPFVMETKPDIYPLPLPEDEILLGIAGKVTSAKQVEFLLRSMSAVENERGLHLVLIGSTVESSGLLPLVEELGLEYQVTGTGYCATIEEFDRWLASADHLISFREPTVGETSSGILRAWAVGTPSVVFDHGSYAEIPAHLAEKIGVLDEVQLQDWLANCEKPSAEKRAECKKYIEDVCDPILVARQIVAYSNNNRK